MQLQQCVLDYLTIVEPSQRRLIMRGRLDLKLSASRLAMDAPDVEERVVLSDEEDDDEPAGFFFSRDNTAMLASSIQEEEYNEAPIKIEVQVPSEVHSLPVEPQSPCYPQLLSSIPQDPDENQNSPPRPSHSSLSEDSPREETQQSGKKC